MSFLSPMWLLGLPAFAVLAVWLLLGRRKRQWVAFLPLWRGPVRSPRMPQAMEPPPIYLVLALAGVLAALLAASRPVLRGLGAGHRPGVNVVVDCGATMSASYDARSRYAALVDAVRQPLLDALGPGPVQVIDVPRGGSQSAGINDWADIAGRLQPTGLRTRDALSAAVASLLEQQPAQSVIVLSDQHCDVNDPRLVQIPPAGPIEHIGIVELAARDQPQAQVMVRLRNDSDATSAELGVGTATQAVRLGGRGTEQNFFFSEPLGKTIHLSLNDSREQAADHQAWAVWEGNCPRFEIHGMLAPTLGRMVQVYSGLHPPRGDAPAVALGRGFSDLPAGQAGIALAQMFANPTPAPPATAPLPVIMSPHPITKELSGGDFAGASVAEDAPTAAGWEPVMQIGGRAAVMVRSTPQRQVWVGFDAPDWGSTPAFVIFWTNVFDWVSGPAGQFAWHPLTEWQASWKRIEPPPLAAGGAGLWPGVYQGPGQELRAFNALDLRLQSGEPAAWQEALRHLPLAQRAGWPLAPALLLFALALLALAGLTWRPAELDGQPSHES